MTEMEKVIKGLECCSQKECDMVHPKIECPYIHLVGEYEGAYYECTSRLAADTLALIRKQEPVKPTKQHIEKSKVDLWYCGECGNWIGQTFTYCPWCGKAVKWDE